MQASALSPSIFPVQGPQFFPFEGLYEPSAISQLPDGRVLVLQDEAALPVVALAPQAGGAMAEESLRLPARISVPLSDLEGAARKDGFIYAITSHARRTNGARQASREQLVRFEVRGDEIVTLTAVGGLKEAILEKHPGLRQAMDSRRPKQDGFNIEGLAFDAEGRRLLVALRKPLIDGQAILLTIENPDEVFAAGATPRIGPELIRLDLGGRGIRAMEYIPELKGHLILAGNKGRSEAQQLWFWPETGAPPQPASIARQSRFANGEGLARVQLGEEVRILIVSDEGNPATGLPATYLMAPLEQVRIGEGAE